MIRNAHSRVGLLLLGLLIASNSQGSDRYVLLRQPGPGALDATRAAHEVAAVGGKITRVLRYHDGVVAELTPQALSSLQSRLGQGVRIEKDSMARVPEGELPAVDSVSAQGVEQPPQTIPWGVVTVRGPDAHAITRGDGVLVCVVDTGIQPDHPDLADNIAGGENFVSDDTQAWGDDCGHGTHVAGIIAALDNGIGVVGVAPEAKLFSAKALDAGGYGTNSSIAEGIRSCVAHHAQVINLSLVVTEDSPLIHDAIVDARRKGAVIVAAAGNSGGQVFYPAKYPEVIAISGVDMDLKLAPFSSWGSEIAFTAPGAQIYSTMLYGRYAFESGTSMAAPHVSGVEALSIAARRNHVGARDLGLSSSKQGAGLIDALISVTKTE